MKGLGNIALCFVIDWVRTDRDWVWDGPNSDFWECKSAATPQSYAVQLRNVATQRSCAMQLRSRTTHRSYAAQGNSYRSCSRISRSLMCTARVGVWLRLILSRLFVRVHFNYPTTRVRWQSPTWSSVPIYIMISTFFPLIGFLFQNGLVQFSSNFLSIFGRSMLLGQWPQISLSF